MKRVKTLRSKRKLPKFLLPLFSVMIIMLSLLLAVFVTQQKTAVDSQAASKMASISNDYEVIFFDNFNTDEVGVNVCGNNSRPIQNWNLYRQGSMTLASVDVVGYRADGNPCSAPQLYHSSFQKQIDIEATFSWPTTAETKNQFILEPGTYELSFYTAKFLDNKPADTFHIYIKNDDGTMVLDKQYTIEDGSPATRRVETFTVTQKKLVRIYMEDINQPAHDNIGTILDDVQLVKIQKACTPRPACLDARPRPCEILEPDLDWCPQSSPSPSSTVAPKTRTGVQKQ